MATLLPTDTAPRIFFDQARRPGRADTPRFMVPAPGGGWTPVSWGEALGRVEAMASFLIDDGVAPGGTGAVLCNTRLEWGLFGLALLAARGRLVPVYPSLTPELLAHVLGHSDAETLLVETAEQLGRVLSVWPRLNLRRVITVEPVDLPRAAQAAGLDPAELGEVVLSLEEVEARGAASLARDPERVLRRTNAIQLDDVAYIIYTSGTTGLPKGVLLSHRNVGVNGADWVDLNGPALHEGDVDLLWLPMSHVFGWGEFCLGNQLGFLTYFSDPLRALGQLPEVRPNVFMSVPAYWEKLAGGAAAAGGEPEAQQAELRRLCGGRLRFCLSGGAGLRREVKEQFLAAGMLIIEGYGLTECSPTLTMNRRDDFDFASVGKPFPSVELRLADDGEILARGDNVFVGYHKDPEATAAMFDAEGWLRTGDLGHFNQAGFLQIIGRKKEILVTAGGKNVPPENIELRFRDDPLISQLVVYGDGKKYLVALVDIDETVAAARLSEAGEDVPGQREALRAHPAVRSWVQERIDAVNATLARYETLKKFAIAPRPLTMEAGFVTPSLKVKRAQVYKAFGEQLEALY